MERRVQDHVRQAVLQHLREHGDKMWREIAGAVLNGQMTLREAAASPSCREQLIIGAQSLIKRRDEIGEVEFEEEGRRAGLVVEEIREQAQREET